jgi:septal ring factor EnvC (AmiA/AmiB activator)
VKTLSLIAILLFAGIAANAQCTASAGFQCVPNADMDRISKDLTELKASRDVIAKFQAERTATDAERAATTAVLKAANDAIDTLNKGIADRDKLIDLQNKTLTLYADLVEKLTTKLNTPKSAFSKFMTALKEIAYLAAGIALGRGL